MNTTPNPERPLTANQATLLALLESFNQGAQRVVGLFHPEAVIHFPYAHSLGTKGHLTLPEYQDFLHHVLPSMPAIAFTNTQTYQTNDPEVVIMETHGKALIAATGQEYNQDYVMVVTFREGKIYHYKEYWNTLALEAFGSPAETKDVFNP